MCLFSPPSRERSKFCSLRDGFTQVQKSNQHLEREIRRLKERESELLAFSEKLSTANAELQAERSNWETKVCVCVCVCVLCVCVSVCVCAYVCVFVVEE